MGKKIKKLVSKANSAPPSMIEFINKSKNKNKSKENPIENNINKCDLPKRNKIIKRKRVKGRKYKSLKIIFINRRIHEITEKCKIKKLLLKLYENKLDKLTEQYNNMILSQYNCLGKNNFIR